MSKRKKIILILILGLLLTGALYYFLVVRKGAPRIPGAPIPTPKITSLLKGEFSIELLVDEAAFAALPTSSPILERRATTISREEIVSIAGKLGFTNDPVEANDVLEGAVFIFSQARDSFVATPKTGVLDYTLNELPSAINKQLSEDEIKSTAQFFLVDNGFVALDEIVFGELLFLRGASGEGYYQSTREAASFYQVNFYPKAASRTILKLNPQDSLISVRILPDGEIFSAHVVKLGILSESSSQYKLKPYSEFSGDIGKAVLVSLDEGNIYLPDLPPGAISKVSVTEVELAYFLESKDSLILQPVYLLKGETSVSGYPGAVSAFLYLPAISLSN